MAPSAQREHPQGPTLGAAPDPARSWKAGAGRGAGLREQVRRLGCLTPHNQRIVTPRLQPGAVGCRHPRAVPLAFGDSEQFDGLARVAVVDALSVASQVDAGCQPKRATHHRCYRHSRTRGACRSRLGVLPAHKASRARPPPKTMRTVGKVVNPPSRPHPTVTPTPS